MSGRLAAMAWALSRYDPVLRLQLLRQLTVSERRALHNEWSAWAHDGQIAPPGRKWGVWLIRAGRGFGKTRAGAEWVSQFARDNEKARIALVGGTAEDVRRVMIEGASGVLAVARHGETVTWTRDRGEVGFASGAKAYVFSAEAPEALRGPEHDAAWCDELAKWRYGDQAWDNLMLGNQGGDMVESVLRAADAGLPITTVHAARGKVARAEPVAALYEKGRMFHVSAFPALEDELAGLATGGGYEGPGRSPDRADALVWAATYLMLKGPVGQAGLRVV